MRLEHHLVGGYVRYISPYIIIIINHNMLNKEFFHEIQTTPHTFCIYFQNFNSDLADTWGSIQS